jgi:hypothetical protein
MIFEYHPLIAWRRFVGNVPDNTVYGLMISGGSASFGERVMR